MISLEDGIQGLDLWKNFNANFKKIVPGSRNQNMPQELSECLSILIARQIPRYESLVWSKGVKNVSGDAHIPASRVCVSTKSLKTKVKLHIKPDENTMTRVEIKCFTSDGPISFGPKEAWDVLLILDACDYIGYNFALYEIPMKNDSSECSVLQLNKSQTFAHQCEEGRRPRLSFSELRAQLGQNCKLLWSGDIRDLLKK